MKSLPNVSLAQINPEIVGNTDLNCCGDPDCGNYGVAPDIARHSFAGTGVAQRRQSAAANDPGGAAGCGRYRMVSESRPETHRETDAFEFAGDPVGWTDGRTLICRHMRGNGDCGVGFTVKSNRHLDEERKRLTDMNGTLEGPRCGACGTRCLDAP